MKRCLLAVLMTGLLLGAALAQDVPKGDHDRIQGTWKVISVLAGPAGSLKKVPDEKIKDGIVVITKDKLVFRKGKESDPSYYKIAKLDPTKKPKWIDFTFVGKDREGKTYEKPALGIYELDGDDLKLFFGDPSPEPKRPTDFEASKVGIILMVLKRDKN